MKILALDTSTELCSVALWLDGETFVREELAGQRHSELVLPMVDELLAEAGLDLKELDGIAFGEGPGSFTGLRIGCGVAQGLAFGADLPVAGICTLLAMAEASGANRVIACLDARMGEIYHGVYEKIEGGWQALSAPGLGAPQHAPEAAGEGWIGCGNGFAVHGEVLAERYAGQLAEVMPGIFPHAAQIACLGAERFRNDLGVDAAEAAPLYIRNKVALKTSER
ncbi:MAG: tRNA (adenosine(37)-N6)-threonylcarbamoyltransferase complex dimerization subunit type 1 TsaB [Betaproteobacteria bacterium]|nr:tRNA (adenosine(37)-N6)-threonylcarbamoyltransferase complex dimerization subunit type 1 TsaB [Betaproteobacteria bacterium]